MKNEISSVDSSTGFNRISSPPLQQEPSTLTAMAETSQLLSVKQSHIGRKTAKSSTELNGHMHGDEAPVLPNHPPDEFLQYLNNLVQYPSETISTTVEKASEASTSLWGDASTSLENYGLAPSANGFHKKSRGSKKSKEQRQRTSTVSSQDKFDKASVVSEQHSEHLSDVVSSSGMSTLDSGILRMASMSESLTSAAQLDASLSSEASTQVDHSNEPQSTLDLRRENANSRGQLKSMQFVVEEINKERFALQEKIYGIEKELRSKQAESADFSETKRRLLIENEELKAGMAKWEAIVADYQQVIDSKGAEVRLAKEEQLLVENENESLRIKIEQFKLDIEKRETGVAELNGKTTRQAVEIEGFLRKISHGEEQLKLFKSELKAAGESRNWHESEISRLQSKLKESQQKVVYEQSECLVLRSSLDRVQSECVQLKDAMMKLNYKSVKEKEYLLKHLEGIEADIKQASPTHSSSGQKVALTNVTSSVANAKLETDIARLKKELADTKHTAELRLSERDAGAKELSELHKKLQEKGLEEQSLRSTISELQSRMSGLNVTLKSQTDLGEIVQKEKAAAEVKIAVLKQENRNFENDVRVAKENSERYERAMKQLKSDLVAKESKLDVVQREVTRLESQLAASAQTLPAHVQDTSTEMELLQLRNDKINFEKVLQALNTELRTVCSKMEAEKNKLKEDADAAVATLESQLRSVQEKLTLDLGRVTQEKQTLQREVERLSASLSAQPQVGGHAPQTIINMEEDGFNKAEKIRMLEANLRLLMRKYKEGLKERQELEEKLQKISQAAGAGAGQVDEIETASVPVDGDQTEVRSPSSSNESSELMDLSEEIKQLRSAYETKDKLLNEREAIILRLELEKGELVKSENAAARQQLQSLEAMVEAKNHELEILSLKLRESEERAKDDILKLETRITGLTEDLKKERALVKDLRHTIFLEKRDASYAKKDIGSLKKALTEANIIADKKRQEAMEAAQELDQKLAELSQLQIREQQLAFELSQTREEVARVKSESQNGVDRERPLLDQMSTLNLTLREKDQELETLNYKLADAKRVHESEVGQIQFYLNNLHVECEQMKAELAELRTERFNLLNNQAELRAALQANVDANTRLKAELESCNVAIKQADSCPYDQEFVGRLLSQSMEEDTERRPLNNLQTCLDSLKEEMDSLQKQLSDNQTDSQTNNEAVNQNPVVPFDSLV